MSETRTCQGCGADSPFAFEAVDRNRRSTAEHYRYYRCPSCGLVFLNPVPAPLDDYYAADYHGAFPTSDELAAAAAVNEGYKLDLLRRFASGRRLLDVGSSIGGFAYLAKRAGYEVEVVEMDPRCCEYVAGTLGIPALQTDDIRSALESKAPFDAITFWHVIEHVRDPFDVLPVAARALRPGGVLVIAAPNPQALQFRLFGRRWTHLDAPRHLTLIPPSVLLTRGVEENLDVRCVTTSDRGGLAWNLFGWRETLALFARADAAARVLRSAGSLAAWLARPIERRGMSGATYTVVLEKPL